GAGFKEIFYCNIGKENPLEVVLTGRADLQIELENNHIIFDYKTGSASASRRKKFLDQLLIYELIYYLISDPQLQAQVNSYLYFVEDRNLFCLKDVKTSKSQLLAEFRLNLETAVNKLLTVGYEFPRKGDPADIIEITRRDLFVTGKI
ncbi:MAG: PD-(D/E)XK nuclease family protein, partial [Candidatus Cloacimonetes bacterium]|nr:PD-(D/E)XK nuclease family protein [Candidatus Cloacimonadota bacterium]